MNIRGFLFEKNISSSALKKEVMTIPSAGSHAQTSFWAQQKGEFKTNYERALSHRRK